jgi:hypothetical protein
MKFAKCITNYSKERIKMAEKIIYSKWVACELRKQGFPIVRVEVNPNKPQFDCWVFAETAEMLEALTRITSK